MEAAMQLKNIIENYTPQLRTLTEESFSLKPAPGKWSKKEELGHLVDSAHNNLRRFIVAQHEINPKITYEQDAWVAALVYQKQYSTQIIDLWALLNTQIYFALSNIPAEVFLRLCNTGKTQPQLHTIQWLAGDYVKHLLHHLHHILELESVAY
jgi:hypothetical protein